MEEQKDGDLTSYTASVTFQPLRRSWLLLQMFSLLSVIGNSVKLKNRLQNKVSQNKVSADGTILLKINLALKGDETWTKMRLNTKSKYCLLFWQFLNKIVFLFYFTYVYIHHTTIYE